jgi:hypothetical protein
MVSMTFTKSLEKLAKEYLKGGKADGCPDSAFPKDELKEGIKVESEEHVKDKRAAKEIAKDHIAEKRNYYKLLKKCKL